MNYLLFLYLLILVSLFLFFRSRTWTDDEAAPGRRHAAGFGPRISLSSGWKKFLTHGGPRILVVACLAAILTRLALVQWTWWDAAVVVGVIAIWPLQEWVIHAQLEHLKPFRLLGREVELVLTRTHRAHHRNPWEPRFGLTTTHLIVVLLGGTPLVWIGPAIYFGYSLPAAITGVTVTFLLILNYEWTHFLIHTSYQPRSKWFRRLWKNHRLHHFENENYWFGLTMLSGDRVLGTQPEQGSQPRSPTCMNLGVDADLLELTGQHDESNS